MRSRAGTLTTVTLFAVAVALVAFVAGNGDGAGLVKLPVASVGGESAAADRSALYAPAHGGVEYRVVGDLPALPSEAAAYRLGGTASTEDVARLAAALGLDGEVRDVDGAWAVRDGDRELRVERYPGLPWYLGTTCESVAGPEVPAGSETVVTPTGCEVAVSTGVTVVEESAVEGCKGGPEGCPTPATTAPPAPTVAPAPAPVPAPMPVPTSAPCPPGAECAGVSSSAPGYAPPTAAVMPCEPGTRCVVDPAARVTTVPCEGWCPAPTEPAPLPEPVPPPERPARPADFPSRADAERIARETFTRLGAGLDGFAMDDGWVTWEARVETRVDGTAVLGQGWWLGVGAGGRIAHGGGFLGRPEKIGDYPLAGVETGLRRLNEDFGAGVRTMTAESSGTDEAVEVQSSAEAERQDAALAEQAELRAAEERKLAEIAGQPGPSGAAQSGAPQSGAGPSGAGQSGAVAGVAPAAPAVDLPSPVVDCTDPNVPCQPPVGLPEPLLPPEQPEKAVLDVTGARLVLLQLDGLLVPSYVFELAGGGESPPVPAVTDEWLDREGVAQPPKG